jgi:hypothetical protein
MKINMIWCVKSQYEKNFSLNWIEEIFSKFEITHIDDFENRFQTFENNSVIIVSVGKDSNNSLISYIQEYNKLNLNYSILHLSDEAFEQNIDFYDVSRKIIRNYYNEEYTKKFNLMTIPLGYQSGVKKNQTDKTIEVNFVGQLKSDRYEMLNTFKVLPNSYFYLTRMWNDPDSLNLTQYSEVLSRSWFTLCPRGWISLDSFRINEALECGSIPVSIFEKDGTDYFEKIYGDHPFIVAKDWNDVKNQCSNVDKRLLNQKVNEWFVNFKSELRKKLQNFITKKNNLK